MSNKTALITGASKGLGFALAEALSKQGWNLMLTARTPQRLLEAKRKLSLNTEVLAISGDVRDEIHLLEISDALQTNGWTLDLVVNNASSLGLSPLQNLLDHPVENIHTVLHTNMIAPISLLQKVKSFLNHDARIINISSDAGKEAYPTWGVYGGSKAGLDHMTTILEKENPQFRFYAFDPGDMQTEMHQAAFPGEDISDRPLPGEFAVPTLIELITEDMVGGRYATFQPQMEA